MDLLLMVGISLCGLGLKKTIHIQPVHKGIEPTIAGSIGIPQAETMTPILVKVKLNRYTCFVPGINDAKLAFEKKIIGGDDVEHGRSVFWHFYRAHPAIDRADKSQVHGLGVQRSVHGEAGAG